MNEDRNRQSYETIREDRGVAIPASEKEVWAHAALLVDTGLEAALSSARPGATPKEILESVRSAVKSMGNSTPEVQVLHGFPLAVPGDASLNVDALPLQQGELVWVRISGTHDGQAYVGSRTAAVGKVSKAAQNFLEHLSETAEWFCETLHPTPSRRFVLTETRGCLLRVRGGGLGASLAEDPSIEVGTPVALDPGRPLWIETSLACPNTGTASIADMVFLESEGAERLTKCPRRWPEEQGGSW